MAFHQPPQKSDPNQRQPDVFSSSWDQPPKLLRSSSSAAPPSRTVARFAPPQLSRHESDPLKPDAVDEADSWKSIQAGPTMTTPNKKRRQPEHIKLQNKQRSSVQKRQPSLQAEYSVPLLQQTLYHPHSTTAPPEERCGVLRRFVSGFVRSVRVQILKPTIAYFSLVLLFSSTEQVTRKVITTNLFNYRWFLMQLMCFLTFIITLSITLIRTYRGQISRAMRDIRQRKFLLMAVFDFAHSALILIPTGIVPGPLGSSTCVDALPKWICAAKIIDTFLEYE